MLKLIIEDDEGRKTVVPFSRDEITIGRQEGNTIRLTERNVSRNHARLLRQNGHVVVEDLGSYTGVLINGERIQGPAQVGDGDLIQIGDYDLALQQEAAAQPGAPTIRVPSMALMEAQGRADAKTETEVPVQGGEEEEEDAPKPTPAADQRRHSTAVIRMDQVEMNRPRKVSAIEPEDAPHLVVVSAEFRGQEFACIRTEIRIGRTDDNDIAIDHRSLSRTHAKLVREDSGEWRIIDLQSANGMAVNGESYAQSSLAHGDLIELGHVKLRFVGPGQSSDGLLNEKTASRGSKKTLLFALAATVLLLVGAVAAWLVVGQPPANTGTPRQPAVVEKPAEQPRQATPPEPATGTATQPAQVDAAAQLAEKLQSVRATMEARDFDKAVSELQPLADSNTEAAELLQQAQAEQQAKQNLDLAQKAFDETRNQDAQKHLEASEGTLAFDAEHAALKAKVEAALAPPTRPGTKSGTARRSPAEQARQLYDDGVTLVRKQQLPEAESVLKKCINLDPTYAPCYLALGAAVARRNRPAEGAQYYREFLRLAPNHEMAPSVRRLVADYDKSQKQPGGGK